MLVIAGVGYKTLFRLAYKRHFFGMWERAEKTTSRVPGDPHREGDGRVPVASATLDDVQIRYVHRVHGELQNIRAVWQDAFNFLRPYSPPLRLPDTMEEAASEEHRSGCDRSRVPHVDGSARAGRFDNDDPGYWRPNAPAAA